MLSSYGMLKRRPSNQSLYKEQNYRHSGLAKAFLVRVDEYVWYLCKAPCKITIPAFGNQGSEKVQQEEQHASQIFGILHLKYISLPSPTTNRGQNLEEGIVEM